MKTLDIKKIQPTKGYVLVEPAKAEEKTASGIILTESEGEKPQHGTVLAVGACDCGCDCKCSCNCGYDSDCSCEEGCSCGDSCGCDDESCSCGEGCNCSEETCSCDDDCDCESSCACEAPVKVGDQVIYKKWGGNDLKIDDIEYQFLKFEDILAVIK